MLEIVSFVLILFIVFIAFTVSLLYENENKGEKIILK